jgi:hypothetical protein
MPEVLTRLDGAERGFTEGEWQVIVAQNELWAKHERLRAAVVETCSAYCASVLGMEENGYPKDRSPNDWHYQHLTKQTAMIDAYEALIAFEAENGIGNAK